MHLHSVSWLCVDADSVQHVFEFHFAPKSVSLHLCRDMGRRLSMHRRYVQRTRCRHVPISSWMWVQSILRTVELCLICVHRH